jgi:cytochrome c-type biogenesis protein CcmH
MYRRSILVLLIFLSQTIITVSIAFAQDGTPLEPSDDEVNAIAKEMYCPVCENIPLDVCPTQACAEWRELIRDKLAEGWSEEQIKVYFVDQFGDRVLSEPPARGLNWLVYIIPPVVLLLGAYIIYRAIRSWRITTPEITGDIHRDDLEQPEDEYIKRMEEELHNL